MKIYFILFLTLFLLGCSNKTVTIKSLQPSQISNIRVHDVILEKFINDNINQTNYIEEQIVNKIVENKRVFTLKPTYKNVDAIITGEVLDSSIHFSYYYEDDVDYTRCVEFEYKDKKRTDKCLRYKKIKIPCERKDYYVQTKIDVLDYNETALFSKIYKGHKQNIDCNYNRRFFTEYFLHVNRVKNNSTNPVNLEIAKDIASKAINDISPHYSYTKVKFFSNFDNKNYPDTMIKSFENIVELLEKNLTNIAQEKLIILNEQLNSSSYEVLYNLALTYENQSLFTKARKYYFEAKDICTNNEDLILINKAIDRISVNSYNNSKAKSQLIKK